MPSDKDLTLEQQLGHLEAAEMRIDLIRVRLDHLMHSIKDAKADPTKRYPDQQLADYLVQDAVSLNNLFHTARAMRDLRKIEGKLHDRA